MKQTIVLLALIMCLLVAAGGSPLAGAPEQQYILKARLVSFTPVVRFELDAAGVPTDWRYPSFLTGVAYGAIEEGYQRMPPIPGLDGSGPDQEFMEQLEAVDPSFGYSLVVSAQAAPASGQVIGVGGSAADQALEVGGTAAHSFSVSLGAPTPHSDSRVVVQNNEYLSDAGLTRAGSGPPFVLQLGRTYPRMEWGGWWRVETEPETDDQGFREARCRAVKPMAGHAVFVTTSAGRATAARAVESLFAAPTGPDPSFLNWELAEPLLQLACASPCNCNGDWCERSTCNCGGVTYACDDPQAGRGCDAMGCDCTDVYACKNYPTTTECNGSTTNCDVAGECNWNTWSESCANGGSLYCSQGCCDQGECYPSCFVRNTACPADLPDSCGCEPGYCYCY